MLASVLLVACSNKGDIPSTQTTTTQSDSIPACGLQCANADLRGVYVSVGDSTSFLLADFRFANLSGATFRGVFEGADFSTANLSGADLSAATFKDSTFDGADLTGTNFANAYFARTSLSNTRLIDANLSGSQIWHSSFFRANLEGADLYCSSFDESNLRGTTFKGAKISYSTFEEVIGIAPPNEHVRTINDCQEAP